MRPANRKYEQSLMHYILLVTTFILIFGLGSSEGEVTWESTIPDVGGWTDGITICPNDGNRVMIDEDVFGVGMSEDGDRTRAILAGILM